jgi:hypothetical protein
MESPSHHELLCVSPGATADEIRASYRRLIRIYHPDVAGDAGAAMTLRLNEAQDALLNPGSYRASSAGSRSSNQRGSGSSQRASGSQSGTSYASAPRSSSANFQREWAPPHKTRPARSPRTSAEWMVVALASIGVIVVSTIVVLGYTYSGPIGLTVRIVPAIIMALVWMTAGLSKPPMATFLLLGLGVLLWPLSAASVGPLSVLSTAIPPVIWAAITLSFVAMILVRTAAPRAAWPRRNSTI